MRVEVQIEGQKANYLLLFGKFW